MRKLALKINWIIETKPMHPGFVFKNLINDTTDLRLVLFRSSAFRSYQNGTLYVRMLSLGSRGVASHCPERP